jgi:Family of unknown function (DUF5681)
MMSERLSEDGRIGADDPIVRPKQARKGDYDVGYGRPPKQYQFKKGQSGNPRGRPPKKLNKTDVWNQIMTEPMYIREEGKAARKITKYEGLCQAQLTKAIKGHTGSAKFVIEEATRSGFAAEQDCNFSVLPPRLSDSSPHSEALFANLNLDLLSDDEKIELARLGQIIDLGGDFTALTASDFERAKKIADKARGKDITPNG